MNERYMNRKKVLKTFGGSWVVYFRKIPLFSIMTDRNTMRSENYAKLRFFSVDFLQYRHETHLQLYQHFLISLLAPKSIARLEKVRKHHIYKKDICVEFTHIEDKIYLKKRKSTF